MERADLLITRLSLLSKSEGTLNESELGGLLYNAKEINMVTSAEGLEKGYDFFRNLIKHIRERNETGDHKGIRVLVEVSKDNLHLVKKYIDLEIKVNI